MVEKYQSIKRSSEAFAAIEAWVTALADLRNYSEHTTSNYAHDARVFVDFLGRYRGQMISVADLERLDVTEARSWLGAIAAAGVGAASRARAISALRSFYKWLAKEDLVQSAVLKTLRTPKKPSRAPHPMSHEQIDVLMAEADTVRADWVGYRDRALFTLLYGAGLRISEGLQLDGDAVVAMKAGRLRIMGKGSKERVVPILPVIVPVIEAYLAASPYALEAKAPLFRGEKGDRLNPGVAQRAMRSIRKQMLLPEHATPHALRHSFASHLLNSGADLRSIQELLGHASLSTTQQYTKIDETNMIKVFEASHPRAKIS